VVVSGFIRCICPVLSDIIASVGLNSDNRPPVGTSTYCKLVLSAITTLISLDYTTYALPPNLTWVGFDVAANSTDSRVPDAIAGDWGRFLGIMYVLLPSQILI
jgi:hypothetical protein